MKIEYTKEEIYSLTGDNLLFAGAPKDFVDLSEVFYKLMRGYPNDIHLNLVVPNITPQNVRIILKYTPKGRSFATIQSQDKILFELDAMIWARLFTLSIVLSREGGDFYLISGEDELSDYDLEQDCNVIWTTSIL